MEKKIQDFRNLNLDSSDDEIYKNKKSSLIDDEFYNKNKKSLLIDDEFYNKNKKSSLIEQEFILEIPTATLMPKQSKSKGTNSSKNNRKINTVTENRTAKNFNNSRENRTIKNFNNDTGDNFSKKSKNTSKNIQKNNNTQNGISKSTNSRNLAKNNTEYDRNNEENYIKKDVTKKINSKSSNDIKKNRNKELYDQEVKKKSKARLVISFLMLILVLIGICAGLLTTDAFNVTIIDVQDGTNVTSAEIQRYFDDVKDKNTFLINIGDIEKEIENHPYIYKANITRNLPNKLVVKYEERVPYAIIKYLETYVLLDKYGSILELMQENKYENLPIIYGIEDEKFAEGYELEGISKLKYENIVYLLRNAEHINFEYTISELNYSDTDELILAVKELDVKIIYGTIDKEIISDKLAYLSEILKKLVDKKGTLDISSENYSEKVIFSNDQIGGVNYEQ